MKHGHLTPSMRNDLLSAYLLTGVRVGSWILVSALVYRHLGSLAFAMFALGRSTVGLLAYTAVGIGPAMIRLMAEARATPSATAASAQSPVQITHSSGIALSMILGIVGVGLTVIYSGIYAVVHVVPSEMIPDVQRFILLMGIGVVLRVVSDASGAVLQTHGQIALDNGLQTITEALWTVGCFAELKLGGGGLASVGGAFLIVSGMLWIARFGRARRLLPMPRWSQVRRPIMRRLLIFGGMVMFSQSAEFLYAPADFIVINRLLSPELVASYAPALQIDGALLLLVTAVGAVLLPKAAVAHADGDLARVRMYYIRGTLMTSAILLIAAVVTVALSKWIFLLWLGDSMPLTRTILPAVMLHTVVGGSSAVGRSILIGMGRVRPYTMAVLIAGVMNMVLAIVFVAWLHWGLWGIVIATNLVVLTRAGVWQPWYVLRMVDRERKGLENSKL